MKNPNRPSGRVLTVSILLLVAITWHGEAFGGRLDLTWVNTSSDGLGFSIERSTGTAGTFAQIATTRPGVSAYTDSSLDEGSTYCYRVRAFNSVGYSDYSNSACGTAVSSLPTLALDINQQAFGLGDSLQVDVTVTNAGPPVVVDAYFGALLPAAAGPAYGCPSGDAVAFLVDGLASFVVTCLSDPPSRFEPLYHSVVVPGELLALTLTDFFSVDFGVWPLAMAGDYTLFIALTNPATITVVAAGTATLSYTP